MRHSGTALKGHIEGPLINKCSLVHDYIYLNPEKGSGETIYDVINYFKQKMNQ